MNKKSIASLELAALVHELVFLKEGKVSQIYQREKKELLLQLHARGAGKHLLKIIPGKLLCLTTTKGTMPAQPKGFCMQLRKYLNNAIIRNIYQQESERIIVFVLEKEEKYNLIIELFSKGNIILTDAEWNILGALEKQIWKDRVVKHKETYAFPEAMANWKTLLQTELQNIISKSEKKNIAIALATEIGLGGVYAEEICTRAEIDKNSPPSSVTKKDAQKIHKALQEILSLIEQPAGYIYQNEITPFPLSNQEPVKVAETYNEAINTLNPFEKTSPYQQKLRALEKTIETQEQAIVNLQQKIEENTAKADTIYQRYQPLQNLLRIVTELKKTKEWQEVAKELQNEKKIRQIDLKQKRIIIDL